MLKFFNVKINTKRKFIFSLTKKRAIVRAQARDSNLITHPVMGINVLNAANTGSTTNISHFRNNNNYSTITQLQKKTEYRSQPDITKINRSSEYFNNISDFQSCLDQEILKQKASNSISITKLKKDDVANVNGIPANYSIIMRPKKVLQIFLFLFMLNLFFCFKIKNFIQIFLFLMFIIMIILKLKHHFNNVKLKKHKLYFNLLIKT